MIMKKYFFVAFQLFYGKKQVGYGGFVVVCSCCFERIVEELLDDYNKHAEHNANKVIITALTVLDKQTAAQLSNNFTDNALIIDDGEKEEEVSIDGWLAREINNDIWLYICKNKPIKEDGYWSCDKDADCMEIDGHLFQEVKWSDAEPTKVKLVIYK